MVFYERDYVQLVPIEEKKVSVLHCGSEIYAIFWHLKLFEKRVFIRYG